MRGEDDNTEIVQIIKAISSPIRLSIIEALQTAQMSFSELIKYTRLGEQGAVGKFTYHLKTLMRAGLIEYSSKTRTYSLTSLGKNMLDMVRNLHRRSISGGVFVQNWDYSVEPIHRGVLAEYIAEALQTSADLARRVSVLVEKRLEELHANIIPRWLVEDYIRAELIMSKVDIDKTSNIAPSAPPIHMLHAAFQKSLEKGSREYFNRYVYETLSQRLVVEKLFPRQLKRQYLLGELDLYPAAMTPTHIFSASLEGGDESTPQRMLSIVFNDFLVKAGGESGHRFSPDPCYGLPESIYDLIDFSIRGDGGHLPSFKSNLKIDDVLRRFAWAGRISLGLPAKSSDPLLYSLHQDGATFFTQFAIRSSVPGGFGIQSFIGINILRLLKDGECEESIFIEQAAVSLGRLGKYLERCTHYLSKLHRDAPSLRLLNLLAPIGLAEALKPLINDSETLYVSLMRVLRCLMTAANNVSSLRARVLIASRWPSQMSARIQSIDRALMPSLSAHGAETPLYRHHYSNSFLELIPALGIDQLRSLIHFLGGIVLDDVLVDNLEAQHGREQIQDLLQSLPILLARKP
ncbi:MAG: winged helix-turn-helix domain-containing protein [Nitrososphaerota archaeon]|nr:winged helix-turn-helix domain-containing protein [Candidatus Calditenuaceae archaeon]MDW8073217.1 winged helix-turn-helix domain-containing protein [Nitrososphaerota archaeon]